MPVSVVCEATANVNAALRESLGSANACTVTSAAVGDDVKVAIVSANGAAATTITNTTDVCDNLQNKLVASAKIALFTKIEYEEATNYSHSVLDNLKSKYHVLKSSPPSYNGEINRNSQMTIYNQSENSSADINGNTTTVTPTTISSSNSKLRGNANELPQPKRILYPRENVQIGWEATGRSWKVGVGMINVGNTCYLNSTLQALFHVPSMANWLISDSSHIERCDTADTGCIICAMIKTLIASQNSISSIRPYCVYSKLKSICKHLVMGRQEDAHEFLRYLVEAMEKAYLSRFRHFKELDQFSKETTPLNQILGGYLKSAVRCLACNHISVTFQHFQDLLLDIRKADTIEEALEGYFSRERLEDMGYRCEACKKKVSATKQFTLERAPIVLCIQLKRFSMLGTKLNKQITLTPKLDLTKYASKQCTIDIDNRNEKQHAITYRLVAMVTHLGASQHCGHYTAIGLTKSGTYYNYDDSYVRPISMQNVCNTNAYIIFYEMDSQPLYAMSQQQQQQQQQIACTQISNISSNSAGDVAQTIKINGHPNVLSNCNSNNSDDNDSDHENSQTQQRIIGPQLPPSKLGNYGGSTITTSTTTTIATIATNASTNLLTNSNKLSVNSRCSNSLSSSGASSSLHNISNNSNNSNNSKIMIHFKNNNNNNNNNNSYVSNTATVNSIKTSTTTCSSTMPTAPVSTIISSSNNNNNNNNNNNSNISSINKKNDSNTPASCNYSSHYKNESLIKTAASTKLTTVAATTEAAATTTIISKLKSNKRSFCSSSSDDNDDDENDQTTLIAAPSPASASPTLEIISIQKVGSQNTLPSMPKLNVDATAIKTTATTSTTNLSSNSSCNSSSSNLQKQKPAITNENNKKSSASLTASSASAVYTSINTSPFKSLVPYGSSETDEESDYAHANINNASLRQTNRDQTSQYQQQQLKRLQSTTNPLKRRFNSINTNQLQQQQRANTSSSNGSGSGSGSGSGNGSGNGNGNGSNSDHDADDDDDHDDHDNNNSSLRVKVKQKKITDFCAKAAKRKLAAPINSIDEIFNSVKLSCNSSSNGDSGSSNTVTQTNGNIKCMKKSSKCLQEDQQQKIVMLPSLPSTAALPDLKITILSSSSSEEDYDDDECKTDGLADEDKSPLKNNCNKKISPLKRPQSTTPSPPLIKTKTGLWQVTLLSPETLKKASNKINNNAKGGIENKAPTEKSSKFLRNPFATNTIATTTTTTAGTGKSTNRLSATSKANNLNTNNLSSGSSKRLKKVATSSSSSNLPNSNGNTKTFNGYGYQRESASDSAINELLKQSHQGYGAPVLTWNGQQADIEKEIKNETRAERQRDWQTSDEDKNAMGDNHNGRQKKTKTSRSNGIGGGGGDSGSCSGMGIRPSGYNPFQEHQDNLKRWKQRYQHHQYHHNHHNHNHNQHARHYNHSNGTASSTSHFRHNFQRNKFKFQRFPYKFTPNANINRHNSNSINGSSGVSGSNTSDCANNNINTPGNNLNYRRDS